MSTIKADTLSNLAGTQSVPVATVAQGSAKAWVNFNGTGTVAIRASFNVSSITDNGTGDYTANFTNAMADADYAASSMGSSSSSTQLGAAWYTVGNTKTTSAFRVNTSQLSVTGSNIAVDLAEVYVQIFR